MELKELRESYVKALDEAERIRVQYAGKSDNMTAEQEATWGKWLDEADTLKGQIERAEREAEHKSWAAERQPALKLVGGVGSPKPGSGDAEDAREKAQVKAFFSGKITSEMPAHATMAALDPAQKALAAQEGDLGGFLVMPQQLVQRLITTVKDQVFIRQLGTVFQLDRNESLGVPVLDNDLSDPTWTSELATGAADTVAPFGKRSLTPHPLAKRVLISNKLLRQAAIDPEAIVMDRLAYRFARTMENAFLNGTGQNQPLGCFVADANGISTARDTTAASATTLAGDDFITTKFSLKPQYWPKATWFVHRLIVAAVRKLKDTQGNYVWQPGLGGQFAAEGSALVGNLPETLVGQRMIVSEVAPSTIATGDYVAILGDFSFYWIVDALNMTVQRLVELYAESNQTEFIGRLESDGMPVLEEAFVRLHMA